MKYVCRIMVVIVAIITMKSFATERIRRVGLQDGSQALSDKAYEEAEKKFNVVIVTGIRRKNQDLNLWEAGSKSLLMLESGCRVVKYSPDGRLIKVGLRRAFEELVWADARLEELKAEAKEIERAEETKNEENLKRFIKEYTGVSFGDPLTNTCKTTIAMIRPFSCLDRCVLWGMHGKVCSVTIYGILDKKYSRQSIKEAKKKVANEFFEKLGMEPGLFSLEYSNSRYDISDGMSIESEMGSGVYYPSGYVIGFRFVNYKLIGKLEKEADEEKEKFRLE